MALWRLGERFGIDVLGAVEGPPHSVDEPRRDTFDRLHGSNHPGLDILSPQPARDFGTD